MAMADRSNAAVRTGSQRVASTSLSWKMKIDDLSENVSFVGVIFVLFIWLIWLRLPAG